MNNSDKGQEPETTWYKSSTDLKLRDTALKRADSHKRTIKLSCKVIGIDQDYWNTRMPSGPEYTMKTYEDSIGTALHNLYIVSLAMIEEYLRDDDDRSEKYTSLGDLDTVYDLDEEGDERETEVESADQVRMYLAAKLMALEIGGQLNLSFDNHLVVFKMWRINL